MTENPRNKVLTIFLIVLGAAALLLAVYFLPPIHDRLAWRVAGLRSKIFYFLNPPGEISFSPAQQVEMEAIVQMTLTAMPQSSTLTLQPTMTPTHVISPTPTQTLTPTLTSTPIPGAVRLTGSVHEYQKMNNCGPATLSMALTYWGWEGDQDITRQWLRVHPDDRNTMPDEMAEKVMAETDLNALVRWGGDVDMLKRLIAAGFPVMVERDMTDVRPYDDWTGHFGVVTAYDDSRIRFILQDSYVMADYPLDYEDLNNYWRAFNFVYLVVYPPEREGEVLEILGQQADVTLNHQFAAEKAQRETETLTGRDLFFALFNQGTSLVYMGDHLGAAQAYDRAFNEVYPTIPERERPWRMLWYQTGPYEAYYFTGRFQDVVNLATVTLVGTGVREIEETWYWRGRARLALGETELAIEDLREALKYRPGWEAAEQELQNLGVSP